MIKNLDNKKIIIIVGIVLVVIALLLIATNKSSSSENTKSNEEINDKGNKDKKPETQTSEIEEKDIIEAYGMSSNDAISLVKQVFNSDNFDYTVMINDNAKYVVETDVKIVQEVYEMFKEKYTGEILFPKASE